MVKPASGRGIGPGRKTAVASFLFSPCCCGGLAVAVARSCFVILTSYTGWSKTRGVHDIPPSLPHPLVLDPNYGFIFRNDISKKVGPQKFENEKRAQSKNVWGP